jgi:hypothetical protein
MSKIKLGKNLKLGGKISFGGTANTPANISNISHLIFAFNNQSPSSAGDNAGYIDYLKVTKE